MAGFASRLCPAASVGLSALAHLAENVGGRVLPMIEWIVDHTYHVASGIAIGVCLAVLGYYAWGKKK